MRSYSASQFKTHALSIISDVEKTGESVIVTKRGKAMVQVVPVKGEAGGFKPGHLRHTIIHMGDIVSPLGDDLWEAAEDHRR